MKWLMLIFAYPCFAQDVLNSGLRVEGNFGMSSMSSKLEGTGFSADQKNSAGTTFGGNVSFGWPNGFRVFAKFQQTEAQMDTPTSVTPDKIDARREETSIYVLANMSEDSSKSPFRLGIGYALLNYSVDSTTPVLMTTQSSQGLMLMGEKDFEVGESWRSGLGLSLYLPHTFSEQNTNTGFNPRFVGLEFSGRIAYVLREDIQIYLMPVLRQDTVKFDGSGNRGVTGGIDSRTTILIPLGMRVDF